MSKKEYRYVGKNTPRKDARGIVTGSAEFIDDHKFNNMLHACSLKSPHAHARILSIDTSDAEKLPGVHAVITHKNIPEHCRDWKIGMPGFRGILDETVAFVGDGVALVAAETKEIAETACELIKVEYEVLPALLTMEEALDPSSVKIYPQLKPHNEIPKDIEFAGEQFMCDLYRGDVEKAFEESVYIVEDEAEYNSLPSPMAAEPPGVVVNCDENNHFEVWATSQGGYYLRMMCGFRMPNVDMDVYTLNTGGSFGNKQSLQSTVSYAMLLANVTHRPVKLFLTKAEQLLVHDLRLGNKIKVKVGLDKDGFVNAVKGQWLVDSGAWSDVHHVQLGVGLGEMQLALCKCKNWDMTSHVVVTNHDPTGCVRGFGGQELKAALLPTVNKLAEKANINPLDFYSKNFCSSGDEYVWRDRHLWTAFETEYELAMRTAAKKFNWDEKWKGWNVPTRVEGNKVYGVGLAVHGNADVGEDNSEAYVRLDGTGHAVLHCAITESGMGQRNNSAKMVAEVLNIPFENVKITPGNTAVNPWEFGLAGSRGTLTTATACVRAAEDARRQLLELMSDVLKFPAEELDTKDGMVFVKDNPEINCPWIAAMQPFGTDITGHGQWTAAYSHPNFCSLFVEVEVDLETGVVKLVDLTGGTDVGQIIDPKTLEMQFQGGFGSAGTDTAINEEHIIDDNTGRIVTHNMIDYKWRTFNDFPPFEQVILEGQPDISKFRAVGFGEIAGSPGPSAIMMAISNAIGKHFCQYPATPDTVLKALGKC